MRTFRPLVALSLLLLIPACSKTVPPTPPPTTHLAVYLTDSITAAQRSAVQAKLKALPGAGDVKYISKQEAYRKFKELFKNRPGLVNIASPDDLPASYELYVVGPLDSGALADVRTTPGVDEVTPVTNPVPPTQTR